MNLSEDNESIARAWIVFTLSEPDSDEYELNFWAFQKMSDLSVDDSYRALDIVETILRMNKSEKVVGMLGAGILEDMLVTRGSEIIDYLSERAASNPDLVKALGGAWKYRIDPIAGVKRRI